MIEHFAHGPLTLSIAFLVSMTGSALGLLLCRHARLHSSGRRAAWLVVAAFAIGGTGIWVMHFVAMLGFSVDDAVIRYDPALTAASAAIAIAVVACGLLIIALGRYSTWKMLIAGLLTGGGIAAMHYTGMAAVESTVELHHEAVYVAAAIAIAVGAATTALWLALSLRRTAAMWPAAAVMAVAVNAMHYTAMLGVGVGGTVSSSVEGAHAVDLIFPMAVVTAIVLLLLIQTVVMAPTAEELRTDERLAALEARHR
ncbi:MHYT domain-containing protein [Glycomyces xiaoerkulensis]|uniref:MHYT domain-containing protein n=1 Tax=Glycomyces xiaoerkulensis TaxID=2038139 RepID=UPI000C269520|nr:MHYT domain-containing protein [Glycomyces xiaoerkulensis]